MLESVGISVEFSHHEAGPGQNEIDLRYADALQTADNIMTFRTVIKEVALQQGTYATFMPKPFTEHPGSGMHTHFSYPIHFAAGPAEAPLAKNGALELSLSGDRYLWLIALLVLVLNIVNNSVSFCSASS